MSRNVRSAGLILQVFALATSLVRASGYSDVATCVAYEETSMDAFLQINGRRIHLGIKNTKLKPWLG